MEQRFAGGVAVGLEGQEDEADGRAVAFERVEEALTLDGESALVVVGFAVDEENRRLDLVGVGEGRHFEVDVGRLPVGALLILEAKGGKGAVVGAAAGDAGFEEVAVGEEIGGHERAVGVAHDGDAAAIDDAEA